MAQTVGQIGLDLVVNDKGFKRQMSGMQQMAGRFAKALAGAFAVKKIVDFGAQAIKLGSDLNEVQNVVSVAFPKMAKQIDDFAKKAMYTSGLSETMSKRYVGTFGAMAKAFGFNEQAAYDMSTALTSLAGDVASFYNVSQDEAYTKLKSVFTGETESLKDLGVVMTQSALDAYAMANGFGKVTDQMSETEKVALRFAFVTDQLSLASGDFARTSGSWANQVRLMKLQFESFMASVGQGLINIFTPVIQVINFLLSKLLTVGNAFRALTELLTGTSSTAGSGIQETADAVGNLSDNMEGAAGGAGAMDNATQGAGKAADGAGKSAKKAAKEMKSLMGFDQINKLSDSSSSDDGGGSGGSGGGRGGIPKGAKVDMGKLAKGKTNAFDGVFKRLVELLDLFKRGFNAAFKTDGLERIQEALTRIGHTLSEIFSNSYVNDSFQKMLDKISYSLGQFSGAIATVAVGIGVFIVESIAKGLERQKERIKQSLIHLFDGVGNVFSSAGNIAQQISETIYNVITSDGAVRIGSAIFSALLSASSSIISISSKLGSDLMKGLEIIILENAPAIESALNNAIIGLAPIFETFEQAMNDFGDAFGRVYDRHISPFIQSLSTGISDILSIVIDGFNTYINPIIEDFGVKYAEVYETHVKPAIASFEESFSGLIDVLKELWEVVLIPLLKWIAENIMPILSPIISFLVDIIIMSIATIYDGIRLFTQILKGLIDFIVGIFTGDWERAFEGIKNIALAIFEAIKGIVSNFVSIVISLFKNLWELGKAIFNAGLEFIMTAIENFINRSIAFWNSFSSFIFEIWRGIKQNALNIVISWIKDMVSNFDTFKQFTVNAWSSIKSTIIEYATNAKNSVIELITAMYNSVVDWFGKIPSKVQEIWTNVTNYLRGISLYEIGSNIVQGLANGIYNSGSRVLQAMKSIIGNAVDWVKRKLGIASPSKLFKQFGEWTGEGLSIGLTNSKDMVTKASQDMISSMLPNNSTDNFLRVHTPQIAMIGDNKQYGEIVAPENNMLAMAKRATELTKDHGNNVEIIQILMAILNELKRLDLNIDGERITYIITNKINDLTRRSGVSPLIQ